LVSRYRADRCFRKLQAVDPVDGQHALSGGSGLTIIGHRTRVQVHLPDSPERRAAFLRQRLSPPARNSALFAIINKKGAHAKMAESRSHVGAVERAG
jgi:hypothetical protein